MAHVRQSERVVEGLLVYLNGSNSLAKLGGGARHTMRIWELYPTIKNKAQRNPTRSAVMNAMLMSEEPEAIAQRSAKTTCVGRIVNKSVTL